MKKLLLPMMMVATMFACQSPETKTAEKADASVDKQTGTFTSLDEKSAIVKQLLEAYMNNDSTQIYAHYADTVKVYDQMANHQEGGKTVPNPGGKAGFAANERANHAYFSDIKITTDNIKTFVFADGRVHSGVWAMWSGKGKYTNQSITVPVHLVFIWEGDKVVREYRFFDPTTLYAEVAASQKK